MNSINKVFEKCIKDLQEFQNFGQKSKVIIRINQMKSEIQEIHDKILKDYKECFDDLKKIGMESIEKDKEIERMNEQLKNWFSDGYVEKLEKENQQLKQQLKKLKESRIFSSELAKASKKVIKGDYIPRKKIEDRIKEKFKVDWYDFESYWIPSEKELKNLLEGEK